MCYGGMIHILWWVGTVIEVDDSDLLYDYKYIYFLDYTGTTFIDFTNNKTLLY